MTFIHDDFLLGSKPARRLYHKYAASEPIFDYHCHISPREIAENRQFRNLFEIWLEGDHYKWRAMRSNGVPEKFVTGNAKPEEKFLAWAGTVPQTLRNPLYHWTHLELKRYFGISSLLDSKTAPKIWKKANAMLATPELSAQGILKKMGVKVVCTTDDPVDSLEHHASFAKQGHPTRMLPAFRPDKALSVNQPAAFNAWTDLLGAAANHDTGNFPGFLEALEKRHAFFHAQGCRLSDHGMDHCFADFCSEKTAGAIFQKVRKGGQVTPEEHSQFASFMMVYFGHLDAKRGWTKQLHLGALRNNNARLLSQLGPDTGFDSIGDDLQARSLSAYLNRLDSENMLPKTILYNLNPADNYVFATMIGNFQDGSIPGKIQYGSGWWFLDQKEGMEWQMNALSSLGLLSRFIGMITDSRSFMSYPRHEYFRRTLCNLIGRDIESGLIPDDEELVGPMIRRICYSNAREYMNFPGVGEAVARKGGTPRKPSKKKK
jgi:glucuronate isomerase